jgi:hypothetical protein
VLAYRGWSNNRRGAPVLQEVASQQAVHEWLPSWPTLIFGALLVLAARGDQLWRLVKGGRRTERTERDADIEREVRPQRELAATNQRLADTYRAERDEAERHAASSRKAAERCEEQRTELKEECDRLRERVQELLPLQTELMRVKAEVDAIARRMALLEGRA